MSLVTRVVDLISGFLLALIALTTFGEATLRYLFAIQIPDAYTLSGYAQAIAIFWGICSATYAGRHITVDLLWEYLGRNGRRLLDLVATLFSALFLGAMTWMLFAKVHRAHGSFEITSVLHWPIWPFIAAAAAGIAVAFLFAVLRLAKIARSGTGEIHD